jgi:hypothetical protein
VESIRSEVLDQLTGVDQSDSIIVVSTEGATRPPPQPAGPAAVNRRSPVDGGSLPRGCTATGLLDVAGEAGHPTPDPRDQRADESTEAPGGHGRRLPDARPCVTPEQGTGRLKTPPRAAAERILSRPCATLGLRADPQPPGRGVDPRE